MATPSPRDRAARALSRSAGRLTRAAVAKMEADLPWFGELTAQERSWVGQIIESGIRGFVQWFKDVSPEGGSDVVSSPEHAGALFEAAPRALAGTISLQQTVDLIRLSLEVVEANVDDLVDPHDVEDVREGVLRYGREIAFATADVYARAAEVRGAWDARLEALVVDAVLRAETDEAVLSRASALGWSERGEVAVVLAHFPHGDTEASLFDAVRRAARAARMDALCAVQGERLVVVLGGVRDARKAASTLLDLVGEGPLVVGPVTKGLGDAHLSARAVVAADNAAAGWPAAPRPVLSGELLPERALAGDTDARRFLVEDVFTPLAAVRDLAHTLSTYIDAGAAIEPCARELFVHPNTVRYRLRQIGDLTGFSPTDPRDAFTLHVALVLGRLARQSPHPGIGSDPAH